MLVVSFLFSMGGGSLANITLKITGTKKRRIIARSTSLNRGSAIPIHKDIVITTTLRTA